MGFLLSVLWELRASKAAEILTMRTVRARPVVMSCYNKWLISNHGVELAVIFCASGLNITVASPPSNRKELFSSQPNWTFTKSTENQWTHRLGCDLYHLTSHTHTYTCEHTYMCRKYADTKHLNHLSVNISVTTCAVKPKTNEQKKEEKVKAMKKCIDERVGHRLGGMWERERDLGGERKPDQLFILQSRWDVSAVSISELICLLVSGARQHITRHPRDTQGV